LRLKPDGLRKFVAAYERALIGPAEAENTLAPTGFRAIFLDRLGALLDALLQDAPYRSHLEQ
jgi:hypothetical protein